MNSFLKLVSICLLLISFKDSCSQEIVGVNFFWGKSYLAPDKTSRVYPIKIDLYVKDFPFPENQTFILHVYKKSSGKFTGMGVLITKNKKARRVESGNLKCSDKFNIEVFHEEYENKEYRFISFLAFDPKDYYFVLDVCCRPNTIANVKTNTNRSFAVAFEIPSFKDDNEFNLLPYFKKELSTFYYCRNKPFTIDFGAQDFEDREGTLDELRYSIQRPQKGYNKGLSNNIQIFKYYPNLKFLDWASGFSDNKPLGNGNSLSIDTSTGLLSGQCNKNGLYSVVIKVEQFRNGKSEGANFREYTFWIVDCPPESVVKPQIKINNVAEQKHLMCLNAQVTLEVENVPGYVYEWKRDGNVIQSGNINRIVTKDEGVFTVTSTDSRSCLNNSVSEPIELKIKNRKPVISSHYGSVFGCKDKPVVLRLENNEFNRTVTWQKFGTNGFVTQSETLTTNENGVFMAKFSPSGCSNDSTSLFAGVLIGNNYPTKEAITKDIIVCPSTNYYYNINEDFGIKSRFNWYLGEELVWEGPNRMQITLPGTYTIMGGEYGCLAKMEVLNVSWGDNCPKDPDENLYIPDVVTINGDNINEGLEIFNLEAFPDLEFFLYNRTGNLIFYHSGMDNIYSEDKLFKAVKNSNSDVLAYRIKYNRGNLPEKVGKVLILRN